MGLFRTALGDSFSTKRSAVRLSLPYGNNVDRGRWSWSRRWSRSCRRNAESHRLPYTTITFHLGPLRTRGAFRSIRAKIIDVRKRERTSSTGKEESQRATHQEEVRRPVS